MRVDARGHVAVCIVDVLLLSVDVSNGMDLLPSARADAARLSILIGAHNPIIYLLHHIPQRIISHLLAIASSRRPRRRLCVNQAIESIIRKFLPLEPCDAVTRVRLVNACDVAACVVLIRIIWQVILVCHSKYA